MNDATRDAFSLPGTPPRPHTADREPARLRTARDTSAAGIGIEDQFTVFGAAGAVVFMLLSGLLLARFTPARAQVA